MIMAKPIADSPPATLIIYKPNISANISLYCHEKNRIIIETANNIISIEIIIKIKLFLLNIKPMTPNPKSIKDNSILSYPFYFLTLPYI
jgi:hypothetical protein